MLNKFILDEKTYNHERLQKDLKISLGPNLTVLLLIVSEIFSKHQENGLKVHTTSGIILSFMQMNRTSRCYKSTTFVKLVAFANCRDNLQLLLYVFAKSCSLVMLFYEIFNKYHIF